MQAKKTQTARNKSIATAVVETLDRRQLMSATITGFLVADNNANYSWDTGDTRSVGSRAYLDANDNAQFDAGEFSALSNDNGQFRIEGLQAGTYRVRQVLPEGWRQTFPRHRDHADLTVADGETHAADFGRTQAVSAVAGTVFNDLNNNGTRDEGEASEAYRGVYFDDNNNGLNDLGERWTSTDRRGNFAFTGLPSGEYRIRLMSHYGWTPTFGADSAIAVVNGSSSVFGLQFAHYQEAEPATYDANKLISFLQIGGTNTIAADRNVGWNIKTQGWSGFISQYVQPQIDWGVRRVMLHNPFGSLEGQHFRADQAIAAREAGLNWLLDDFVSAWAPVIAQGVEVVAYVGSPMNDPSFDGLDDRAWWDRVLDAFDLPLQAGMNIGLDMSLAANPGSRDWAFVEEVRTRGLDVYGEPRPPEAALHWRSSRLFAEDWIWQDTNPEFNPDTYWAARDSQITGEVTRLISRPPEGETWATMGIWGPAYARAIMRQGHVAALSVLALLQAGVTLDDVLTSVPTAERTAILPAPSSDQTSLLAPDADDATNWLIDELNDTAFDLNEENTAWSME